MEMTQLHLTPLSNDILCTIKTTRSNLGILGCSICTVSLGQINGDDMSQRSLAGLQQGDNAITLSVA